MGEKEADRRAWFSGEGMPAGRNRISRERLITHITNLVLYGLRLGPPDLDSLDSKR